MKLLLIDMDSEGLGIDMAVRAGRSGHKVRYWASLRSHLIGDGMVDKVMDWEPSMDWADMVLLTGNSKFEAALAPYFGKGYPIFGANAKAAELELDREKGQQILKRYGVETLPYHTVDNLDDAISLVKRSAKPYAIKPWGGASDKALTCVGKDADECVFMLSRWKEQGLKGQLMLQEKVEGVEIGIAGWFGPGGWSKPLEESFEHKKFLNDDLGCNTGEMGTVIRHVTSSRLFDEVLDPITDYLHECNYVGDCNINCIVDEDGQPWPLEFTMRLGWPDFCIRQSLIQGDPVEWMADLLHGEDTLQVSKEIAVGIVLVHGNFPSEENTKIPWTGFPISGITKRNLKNISFQQVMEGPYQSASGKRSGLLSAGNYLLVVHGVGGSVAAAAEEAYKTAWQIKMPSNLMFRTDIGARLEKDLPRLQKLGFAKGMEY